MIKACTNSILDFWKTFSLSILSWVWCATGKMLLLLFSKASANGTMEEAQHQRHDISFHSVPGFWQSRLAAEDCCWPSSFPFAKWQKSIVTRLTAVRRAASNPQWDTAGAARLSSVQQAQHHRWLRKPEGKQQAQSSCSVHEIHQTAALYHGDHKRPSAGLSSPALAECSNLQAVERCLSLQERKMQQVFRVWAFELLVGIWKLSIREVLCYKFGFYLTGQVWVNRRVSSFLPTGLHILFGC